MKLKPSESKKFDLIPLKKVEILLEDSNTSCLITLFKPIRPILKKKVDKNVNPPVKTNNVKYLFVSVVSTL